MRNALGHGSDACAPTTRRQIAASQAEDLSHLWRGQDVGYSGIHKRARAVLPMECSLADDSCRGHLEVALRHDARGPIRVDGRGPYSPLVDDYWRLCRSHHNRCDGKIPPLRTSRGALARS